MSTKNPGVAVSVKNVSKHFVIPHQRHDSLKQVVLNIFNSGGSSVLKAVNDLSFEVKQGEFFAIVGRNGSGKSTLLKMLAGIYETDTGTITVNGRLAPFIELGVGFNPEMSARDNVYLNGSLLGMSHKQISAVFDEIIAFAELENFIDQKLKNYSSGMQVRLAFSIAIQAQADVLLMDEVLAVGDANFQAKCFRYFRNLKKQKRTLILVSHDMNVIEEFCDRGILLDSGKLIAEGNITKIRDRYNEITLDHMQLTATNSSPDAPSDAPETASKAMRIKSIRATVDGKKTRSIKPNQEVVLSFDVECTKNIDEAPILGVSLISASSGQVYLATNTRLAKQSVPIPKIGETIHFSCSFKNILGNGDYFVEPAVADSTAMYFYDRQQEAQTLTVAGWTNIFTSVHIDHDVKIS